MTTVREATLDILRQTGMTTIFGNPGSTELPMFRDFPDDFRYILGLQESVVMAMADGYAQATRNAAFVNLHSAAGVGHALGNLFTAYKNQTPLVVTAGQQARSILPFEPFLYAERATEFPRPYVKYSVEPARAEDVPAAIARAYHIAMQAPQGPVFVSIPIDDWDRNCEPPELARVSQTVRGDAAMLAQAAEALATARKPVFVVGAGVALDDAWHEVIALAERHEAGVWVAPMNARVSFPEDHRLFQGFLAAFREKIVADLGDADLVLVLGGPAFTYHAEGFGPHAPEGAKLFQLTNDPNQASWIPGGTAIVTNLKAGIADLLAGPVPIKRPAPSPRARAYGASGRALDRCLSAPTDRRITSGKQRDRRGSGEQSRRDARPFANHRAGWVLYLCQWRTWPRSACCHRCRDGAARCARDWAARRWRRDVCYSGAVDCGATQATDDVHHHQQSPL